MAESPNGIVTYQDFTFGTANDGLTLESGRILAPITLRYELYGTLNADRSNVIMVEHAFSGDAHAAGLHSPSDAHPGWWEEMIGPGRAFDTDRFCVLCSNVIGGCQGSTGPGSVNPATGRPYGLAFPVITIGDMVEAQHRLLQHLGIGRLYAIVGGSMGGMQVLEWSVRYPQMVARAIVLASTTKLNAQGIAFNAVGRNAIMSDPDWRNGDYYGQSVPARGLAIARMVGHITYLSSESMRMKFGRRLQERDGFALDHADQFAVESYLAYQGEKFVDRFDANSYIYISKAMDYYDLAAAYGGLDGALGRCTAHFLVISYSSDWLFPTEQSKEIVYSLARTGGEVSFTEIRSPYGHDSFLLEHELQSELIAAFLKRG